MKNDILDAVAFHYYVQKVLLSSPSLPAEGHYFPAKYLAQQANACMFGDLVPLTAR